MSIYKRPKKHKFPYKWTLEDSIFTKDKGIVFSCFACGGGSTMGYKLAGFDVIGCNEIDPKMMEAYKTNHHPKYSYLESITTLKERDDLPEELYNLDILDGSPPCSSFSMEGNREKDWGKKKKFREGQTEQVLDTLFFDFIDLAEELQPKVVIAENVKGLLLGIAREYIYKILESFDKAGYYVSYTLLNASKMGVPQRRERVIFHAIRKDLYKGKFTNIFKTQPFIDLRFNESLIPFKLIQEKRNRKILSPCFKKYWDNPKYPGGFFYKVIKSRVCSTITTGKCFSIEEKPELLTDSELAKIGSFPQDYNYLNNKVQYLIGMSVPPVMMAQIATQIYKQWLSKIK